MKNKDNYATCEPSEQEKSPFSTSAQERPGSAVHMYMADQGHCCPPKLSISRLFHCNEHPIKSFNQTVGSSLHAEV